MAGLSKRRVNNPDALMKSPVCERGRAGAVPRLRGQLPSHESLTGLRDT